MNILAARFSVLLCRIHTSQSLVPTLESLAALRNDSLVEIYLLHAQSCPPTMEESVVLSKIGIALHVREIEPAQLTAVLNVIAGRAIGECLLMMQAGDRLPADYLSGMHDALLKYPQAGLYYPLSTEDGQSLRIGKVPPAELKNDWKMQAPCAFSGCCVKKSWFTDMGGFHAGCQRVPIMDFWWRSFLTKADSIALVDSVTVLLQKPGREYQLMYGAKEVLESATIVRKLSGWCSSKDFLDYARVVEAFESPNLEIKNRLFDHLQNVALELLFKVHPSLRPDLLPYLQFSATDNSTLAEFKALDRELLNLATSSFNLGSTETLANIVLPNLYDEDFSVYSTGSFCHSAQILKDLGLREHTGPFDWIFCTVRSAAHMLSDRFTTFLDPQHYRLVENKDKVDLQSNMCDHLYYKEHFGVRHMFNHHKPFEVKDAHFFRDAVTHMLQDLEGERPCLLLHFAPVGWAPESVDELLVAAKKFPAFKGLLLIRIKSLGEHSEFENELKIQLSEDRLLMEVEFPAKSESSGLFFKDPLDNKRLRRLVYTYLQLTLSNY